MDAVIFNTLARVAAETDKVKRAQLKSETNLELASHFARHGMDMEELAYDLLHQARGGALQGNIVGSVIEVKTVGLGDTDFVEENLRGMRAYWQGKGGQIPSGLLRSEGCPTPRGGSGG